ncbi:MAG: tetratricopeptide repeat protein [Dinghuibacter sp.]|nr:tetratricopeptide repeat protein [Dinghuibacter sp.]
MQRACLLMGFLLIYQFGGFAWQQVQPDSLEIVYARGNYKKADKLKLLLQLAQTSNDPQKILKYSEVLIAAAGETDSLKYLYAGYFEKGTALRLKSDLGNALQSYFLAAKLDIGKKQRATAFIAIADVYSIMGNHNNSVGYYQQAIAVLKEVKDSVNTANALYNLGDEYLKAGMLDSALVYTQQSQRLSASINYEIGEAYCLGNMGKIYARFGNDRQAVANLDKAIGLLQQLNEYPAIAEYLLSVSDIYAEKNNIGAAKNLAVKSYELAKKYGLNKELSDAAQKLSALYERAGELLLSLRYYKEFITYRDSVHNIESVQQVADLRTDFELSRKQKEVDLLATRNKLKIAERNGFIWASLFLAALLLISIYFYTQKVKRNKIITAQKMQEAELAYQKELIQSVITSQDAERKRIGADLHDEVGSALSSLRMMVEKFITDKDDGNKEQFGNETKLAIDRIVNNTRGIAHNLSPITGGVYGFLDALEELLDGVNQFGKVEAALTLDSEHSVTGLPGATALNLYRVLSELVNNTVKHAKAGQIAIEISRQGNELFIRYKDDGMGMEQPKVQKGIGLHNIESRLDIMGADYQMITSAGNGFDISMRIPVNDK